MGEWDFSQGVIAEAQEIGIGARVVAHWSEAECPDQEGTVVGVNIDRHGHIYYAVHIDGDISPTDEFTHDRTGHDGGTIRLLHHPMTPEEVEDVVGRLEEHQGIGAALSGSGRFVCSLMDEAASLLRTQAERIAELERERDAALAKWERADGMDGAVVDAIRQLLYAQHVPLSAFIDDHVANAIRQRNTAQATLERYREALEPIIQAYDECSGAEPSLSVLYRHIDRARSVLEGK